MGLDPLTAGRRSPAATRCSTPTAIASTTARSACSAPTPAWPTPTGTRCRIWWRLLLGHQPAASPSALRTTDRDGYSNMDEIQAHTDPLGRRTSPTAPSTRYGYVDQPAATRRPTAAPATTSALPTSVLVPTLERPNPPFAQIPAGTNDIYLYFAGRPGERPSRHRGRARCSSSRCRFTRRPAHPRRHHPRGARRLRRRPVIRVWGRHPGSGSGVHTTPGGREGRAGLQLRKTTGDFPAGRTGIVNCFGPAPRRSSHDRQDDRRVELFRRHGVSPFPPSRRTRTTPSASERSAARRRRRAAAAAAAAAAPSGWPTPTTARRWPTPTTPTATARPTADNCPFAANRDQARRRRRRRGRRLRQLLRRSPTSTSSTPTATAMGDACDADIDGDGVANGQDNCPTIPNHDQIEHRRRRRWATPATRTTTTTRAGHRTRRHRRQLPAPRQLRPGACQPAARPATSTPTATTWATASTTAPPSPTRTRRTPTATASATPATPTSTTTASSTPRTTARWSANRPDGRRRRRHGRRLRPQYCVVVDPSEPGRLPRPQGALRGAAPAAR